MASVREEKTNAELVNYRLRPGKQIERKLMCQAIQMLSLPTDISTYQYFGYGSAYFVDFEMLHRLLGIQKMYSIERESRTVARAQFNLPYNCIKVIEAEAQEYVIQHDWRDAAVVWLDETSKVNENSLLTLGEVARRAAKNSVMFVTVSSDNVDKNNNPVGVRDAFLSKLGEFRSYIPDLINRKPKEFLGEALTEIICALMNSIVMKKAGSERSDGLHLTPRQFFNVEYVDSKRMLTIGWLLEDEKDQKTDANGVKQGIVDQIEFAKWPFLSTSLKPFKLVVPHFTPLEVIYLKKDLPGAIKPDTLEFLNRRDVSAFEFLYRYYPTFFEVQGA